MISYLLSRLRYQLLKERFSPRGRNYFFKSRSTEKENERVSTPQIKSLIYK